MLFSATSTRFSISNLRSESCSLHEPMYSINPALLANIPHITVDFTIFINSTRFEPTLLKLPSNPFIILLPLWFRAESPCVIPARMNIKQLTKLSHWMAVVMLLNKGVSYSGWLAKYAAAFFYKSRSSVTRLSSFCSSRISADSSDFCKCSDESGP